MAFVERTDLRTRNAVVERDNVSGLYRALLSIHDQHVQEAGQWVDVTEDFVVDGAEGFALRARSRLRHQLRLANDGSRLWFPRNGVNGESVTLGRPSFAGVSGG